TLNRIRSITDSFHLVLHTSPNTLHKSQVLNDWKTIEEDYHWHIESLPVVASKAKSYTFKEVYYTPVSPEAAAARLREAPTAFRAGYMPYTCNQQSGTTGIQLTLCQMP